MHGNDGMPGLTCGGRSQIETKPQALLPEKDTHENVLKFQYLARVSIKCESPLLWCASARPVIFGPENFGLFHLNWLFRS